MLRFLVQEAIEVHRDPIGHYHHWTIIIGVLSAGTLSHGDILELPTRDGSPCSGFVIGFERARRVLGPTISADDSEAPIGVAIRCPAPPRAIVTAGLARRIDAEQHRANLLTTLRDNPRRIFHSRGPRAPAFRCDECAAGLRRIPEARPQLEQLATRADAELASHVQRWLGRGGAR